jgi:hypothetical protein
MLAVSLATLIWAGAAFGGSRIGSVASCPNSYMILGPGAASEKQFQAAMLCLVNAVRKAEKLPALKLATPLDEVDANATATTPSPVSIPAHKTATVAFTFTPAQLEQEEKSTAVCDVQLHITAPIVYDDKTEMFLPQIKS